MSRGPSWRRPISLIAAAMLLVLLTAGPTQAAYQATVDSNESAFQPECAGFTDSLPAKMLKAATAAYKALGYATAAYTTTSFTRAHTLARTDTDWAYYVHSHGDYYWHPGDQRRYSGFREDAGKCNQAVIYSKDIAQKRAGHATNLVVISTCHNAEPNTTLPGAFGIAKTKGTRRPVRAHVLHELPGNGVRQRRMGVRTAVLGRLVDRAHRRAGVRHRQSRLVHPLRLRRRLVGQLHWYGFAGPLVFDCPRCL